MESSIEADATGDGASEHPGRWSLLQAWAGAVDTVIVVLASGAKSETMPDRAADEMTPYALEVDGRSTALAFSTEAGVDWLPPGSSAEAVLCDPTRLHHWWPADLALWLDPTEDGEGVIIAGEAVRWCSRLMVVVPLLEMLAEAGGSTAEMVSSVVRTLTMIDERVAAVGVMTIPAEGSCAAVLDIELEAGEVATDGGSILERLTEDELVTVWIPLADQVAWELREALAQLLGVVARARVCLDGMELLADSEAIAGLSDDLDWFDNHQASVTVDPSNRLERWLLQGGPASEDEVDADLLITSSIFVPFGLRRGDRDGDSIELPVTETGHGPAVVGFSSEHLIPECLPLGSPYLEIHLDSLAAWPEEAGLLLNPGLTIERFLDRGHLVGLLRP